MEGDGLQEVIRFNNGKLSYYKAWHTLSEIYNLTPIYAKGNIYLAYTTFGGLKIDINYTPSSTINVTPISGYPIWYVDSFIYLTEKKNKFILTATDGSYKASAIMLSDNGTDYTTVMSLLYSSNTIYKALAYYI